MTRQQDILDARAAADEWATQRGLPPSGGYSGQWYQDGYLGGWWPDGWLKWWAGYGITPGSLIGGLVVAHQYTSTPVDMNMMLDSEIVTGGGQVEDPERKAMQDTIDGLVSSIGVIGGDLLAPVVKQKSPVTKAVKNLVAGIRAQADAHGINHA